MGLVMFRVQNLFRGTITQLPAMALNGVPDQSLSWIQEGIAMLKVRHDSGA